MKDFIGEKVSQKHKNGKPHLAVIKEDPGFAVVVWREHKENGELIWEGWFYAEETLHLLFSDGVEPQYILAPKPEPIPIDSPHRSPYDDRYDTKSYYDSVGLNQEGGYLTYKGKDLTQWERKLPWTVAQMQEMLKHSVDIEHCGYVILQEYEMPRRSYEPRVYHNPHDIIDTRAEVVEVYCPIISTKHYDNTVVAVKPSGAKIEMDISVSRIETYGVSNYRKSVRG